MASRRMFSKELIASDNFNELSAAAQTLYFHLAMEADDDGFTTNSRGLMSLTATTEKEQDELIRGGFIFKFDTKAVVIRHWKVHNQIRKDTYHPTKSKREKAMLYLDENDIYCMNEETLNDSTQPRCETVTDLSRNRDGPSTQYSIVKGSIEELRKEENSKYQDTDRVEEPEEKGKPIPAEMIVKEKNNSLSRYTNTTEYYEEQIVKLMSEEPPNEKKAYEYYVWSEKNGMKIDRNRVQLKISAPLPF